MELDFLNSIEASLLGAILLDPAQVDRVTSTVSVADFKHEELRYLFELIVELHGAGEPIGDYVLLAARCREVIVQGRSLIDRLGGAATLVKLGDCAQSTGHALAYAHEVREESKKRRLLWMGKTIEDGLSAGDSSATVVEWIDGQLMQFETGTPERSVTIAEAVQEAIHHVESIQSEDSVPCVPTGLGWLDASIGGFYPGELVVLAARPSIGKSALAAQMGMTSAECGLPSLFVSLEMTSRDIALRQLAAHLDVEVRNLRSGKLSMRDAERAAEWAETLKDVPFHLWSQRSVSVSKIRAKARVQKMLTGLSCVIVDYLGLVHATDRRKPRWEQVTEVSCDLKSLAMDLQVPVVALCQLNREAEGTAPRLDHLREAGAIEQDADVVMLLHRESRDSESATLNIAKCRNGATGEIDLKFDPKRVRFVDVV